MQELVTKIVRDVKNNKKKLFANPMSLAKSHKQAMAVTKEDSILLITSSMEPANCFADYFISIYRSDVLPTPYLMPHPHKVHETMVSPNIVALFLFKLNPHKFPSSNGLHSHLLRLLSTLIFLPLARLFALSILAGIISGDWKRAVVTPIY